MNQLIFTTAPSDYDYGWNKEVVENAGSWKSMKGDQQVRLVLGCDDYRAGCQAARYGSGLYFTRSGIEILPEFKAGYFRPSSELMEYLSSQQSYRLLSVPMSAPQLEK